MCSTGGTMIHRFVTALSAVVMIFALPSPGQTAKDSKNWTAPRAQDGHPDLQGTWTNVTLTPMERPAEFKDKPTLTEVEARAFEKNSAKELQDVDGKSNHPLLAAAGSNGAGTTCCSSIGDRNWPKWTGSSVLR